MFPLPSSLLNNFILFRDMIKGFVIPGYAIVINHQYNILLKYSYQFHLTKTLKHVEDKHYMHAYWSVYTSMDFVLPMCNKMKSSKIPNCRNRSKIQWKNVERIKIDTPVAKLHDHSR